ncbi:MAG: glycosyl hydrolase [Bacteroidota bacterium]|nr:glycosyl hydrolase [Bacteroidota bacterium]
MKKHIIILCIGCLYISFAQAQTRSFKRGLGYNNLLTGDVQALSPGVSWAYNWGQSGSTNDAAFKQYNLEYVPMCWNGVNTAQLVTLLTAHPEIKYILGFNEPNFKAQSNLTPTQAAAEWPDLEKIADQFGLTIVGPALNYSPDAPYQDPIKWYDEFFQACPDCRVDHIAVHLYMSSVSAIKSSIDKYKKYGRPIWLTEFCAWDGGTTEASQEQFMFDTVDYLENEPAIFRYAWFKERGYSGGYPYMQLLNKSLEGVLLPMGELYTYMSSYDNNYYFKTSQLIPSEQYISMKGIRLEKTTDVSDHLNITDFDPTYDYVEYNVDIPEAGEYNVFFRNAFQYGDASEVRISVNNVEKGSMVFENKGIGVWSTQQCKATFDAGKQRVRIDFKQGGLKLNWWEITKNEAPSKVEAVVENNISIYPNPVNDVLNIDTQQSISNIKILDSLGKVVYQGTNEKQVNTKNLSKGMYVVQLTFHDGKKLSCKILK